MPAEHHISFHDVLSALNPLQYLPVIGTIYRSVTGDEIPDVVRRIGSLVVSGLMGGPIGVAINLAVTAAEKITGIDLDKTGQTLLASVMPAHHPASTITPALAPAPAEPARTTPPPLAAPAAQAWSPAQLAAYGVTTTADGGIRRADLSGADVLNALELNRIQDARLAYGRTVSLAA